MGSDFVHPQHPVSDKLENLVIHFDTQHTFAKIIVSTTKPVEILAIVVNILFRNA